jgi:hypothetical protein
VFKLIGESWYLQSDLWFILASAIVGLGAMAAALFGRKADLS